MSNSVFYFSYGSNMSTRRLRERVPSATKIDIGILEEHELKFHKVGLKDGSAKCDVIATGKTTDYVYGVVFNIREEEKPLLDQIEGLGNGYEVKQVLIKLENTSIIEAFTYCATNINRQLKPFDWYKEHVLKGAKEHNLPIQYIREIAAIECIEDLDIERKEKELSIYR